MRVANTPTTATLRHACIALYSGRFGVPCGIARIDVVILVYSLDSQESARYGAPPPSLHDDLRDYQGLFGEWAL